MLRLFVGVLLQPLAASIAWSAAKALGGVAMRSSAAGPFVAGLALATVTWLIGRHVFDPIGPLGRVGRSARWSYVAGHELTHALAAWAMGGSVSAMKIEEKGGHVDVSESNAFVALAPYCLPLYSLLVVLGYRVLLWLKPDSQADALFLLLMGATLAFHALMTCQTITEAKQPDLEAAGGKVFSLSVIGCVNGVLVLALLKTLFPETVAFGVHLREAGRDAWWFWTGAWRLLWPALQNLARRFGR
ncbi:MAG TPA: hypothetical protein DCZ01_01340 [Elusimicrobia bacterium]|nr:MAG: hypothetical protein A2X37_00510 [Elusimicrobia bacterium GWA2_66_18]OGR72510.1 MAG: hypothetical protein A2X40_10120 [Elusimicrobia bacterium GWC2_65_9]HAZ07177.1 hypothetical protein [Elusimicrobiota bacterium]